MSTNTSNSDHPQNDQEYEYSTRNLCSDVSQQPSGSGQSTSSCTETKECLDITRENIRIKQENDDVLKHLLQWKRNNEKPAWSTVAPFCRELKAYWHEWETIEVKEDILYKKHFRNIGNDAEYLFIMPAVLRREVFRQLHDNVTGGHLGRRITYENQEKILLV